MSAVEVALRVRAAPERVFALFTGEIGLWWRDDPFFRLTPRSPGRLRFEPGPDGRLVEDLENGKSFEIGRVLAWEPPSRLVFSWRQATFLPDQRTEVEVRFEPVGGETRVRVLHRGWDSVPDGHVARHGHAGLSYLKRLGPWWRSQLAAMAAGL